MSFSGFFATIVLTRTLGQEQYGTYVVVLSVLAWVVMAAQLGLPAAIRKRVSESDDGNFVLSGIASQFGLYLVVAVSLWVGRPYLNGFIGIEATWIIIVILATRLGVVIIRSVLDGQHLVHISSILDPIEWTSRSIIQVSLVVSGFGIGGAFAGYAIGALVATIIGAYFVSVPTSLPSRYEFQRLKSFAQFSWVGSIKGRTFMSMDTIALAAFVPHSQIAIYEVAWSLAGIFSIFGGSIRRTLFPELSKISSESDARDEISGLLRVSLAYSGLFIIPGLVGSALVGDVVLTIYGTGFDAGYYIFLILIFARLLYGYMGQFMSTINALDRPEITFYINIVFVIVNLIMNVVLILEFGWYGAATATMASSGLGLLLGYYYTRQIVDVVIPVREIFKQMVAAGIMALIVLLGQILIDSSLPVVIILICIGVTVYFVSLLSFSKEFRTIVEENLPFTLPMFSSK